MGFVWFFQTVLIYLWLDLGRTGWGAFNPPFHYLSTESLMLPVQKIHINHFPYSIFFLIRKIMFDVSSDFFLVVAGLYILYGTLLIYHHLGFQGCSEEASKSIISKWKVLAEQHWTEIPVKKTPAKIRKGFPTCPRTWDCAAYSPSEDASSKPHTTRLSPTTQ